MKSPLFQNALLGSGIAFAMGWIGGGSRGCRTPAASKPQTASRSADAGDATDASGLRPAAKLPRPQLQIAWRPRYDDYWLAPLITGVLFVWVRIGLAACGISPLL